MNVTILPKQGCKTYNDLQMGDLFMFADSHNKDVYIKGYIISSYVNRERWKVNTVKENDVGIDGNADIIRVYTSLTNGRVELVDNLIDNLAVYKIDGAALTVSTSHYGVIANDN